MSSESQTGASRIKPLASLILSSAVLSFAGPSQAYDFDLESSDSSLSLNTTVRYNLGVRVESRDSDLGDNPSFSSSNYKFDSGDIVTNRLDIVSELDYAYKRTSGFRVSATAWYDDAYSDTSVELSPALTASGWNTTYYNDRYSDNAKNYQRGPYGELLDAYVYHRFDASDVPVTVKAGRFASIWGEALLDPINSIAYSQAPLSFRKSLTSPGARVNELFRPVTQLSFEAGLTPTISLAAQYFLEWEHNEFPDGGSYLGLADMLGRGPERLPIAPGVELPRISDKKPSDAGEWGVALQWAPTWADANVGFYYRNVSEKMPWVMFHGDEGAPSSYRLTYAEDTDLYGVSIGTNISGIAVGADLVYRRNTALVSQSALSESGARGDTYHAVVNAIGLIGETAAFDTASYVIEASYSHLDKVRSNAHLFNGEGFESCAGRDESHGCATKDYYAIAFTFTPTWFRVLPQLDLSAPVTFSKGLKGNNATLGGGFRGQGSYSVGVSADWRKKHQLALRYNDYLLNIKQDGTVAGDQPLSDRGWLGLTYTSTF